MHANYHSHTWRCHHATGTEREYVEAAIDAGFDILGFSDHSPYVFPGGYCSGHRMYMRQTADYFRTVLSLREEYRGKIEIHVGLEIEYYPKFFKETLAFLADYPCEYLILGQHSMFNEIESGAFWPGSPTSDVRRLEAYVNTVSEAMEREKFLYLAHPDLLNFTGDGKDYDFWYRRLCRTAKACDLPVEINILGIATRRSYPDMRFWRIAAEEGNRVVIGVDAHSPAQMRDRNAYEKAEAIAAEAGITPERILGIN